MLYSEDQLYFRKMFHWEFLRNSNYAEQLPLLSMQKILISVHKKYFIMCFNNLQMQQQYNKNLRFFDCKASVVKNEILQIRSKSKTLFTSKWTIGHEKLPHRVNFCIVNDSTKNEKIVHHDQLTPVKENKILNQPRCNKKVKQNDDHLSSDLVPQENIQVQDVNVSDSSESEEFEGHDSDPESE